MHNFQQPRRKSLCARRRFDRAVLDETITTRRAFDDAPTGRLAAGSIPKTRMNVCLKA